jgi:hypothetical protein
MTYVFSRWQRRVVAAYMLADEGWQRCADLKPLRFAGDYCGCDLTARSLERGRLWRRRQIAIERRWPAVFAAWLMCSESWPRWRESLEAMR